MLGGHQKVNLGIVVEGLTEARGTSGQNAEG